MSVALCLFMCYVFLSLWLRLKVILVFAIPEREIVLRVDGSGASLTLRGLRLPILCSLESLPHYHHNECDRIDIGEFAR